jgi:DNA-binding beta-propeller fold protein YncE
VAFDLHGTGFDSKLDFLGPEVPVPGRKMRMKFNKSGQLLLVSAASLLLATFLTACETLTVDFVFVTSSKAAGPNSYGEIDVFEVNSESGFMRQIPTSPFPSGGRNPVAEAVSTDDYNLYVVNQDDNSIVQFVIGNDGKVYPQNTVNTPGVYPVAVAVNGTNLFVLDTYQPLAACSTAAPCSGSVAVLPITVGKGSPPSDTLGSPVANGTLSYWPVSLPGKPDVIEPTGIDVLASGAYLYVATYDATSGANYIFGFSIGSGGALTALNGGAPLGGGAFATGTCTAAFLNAPFVQGTCPAAVASDPTSGYVYVTDEVKGQVHGYSVASSTGLLTPLSGSPFPAGNQPSAIALDPSYPYLYVTNALDSSVTAYSTSNGELTSIGTYTTGLEPVAIGIDPSTNHFLYTLNFLGSGINGTVSGFELSTTAGTLLNSQNSPYLSQALPTAVAAIPHNGTGAGVTK